MHVTNATQQLLEEVPADWFTKDTRVINMVEEFASHDRFLGYICDRISLSSGGHIFCVFIVFMILYDVIVA